MNNVIWGKKRRFNLKLTESSRVVSVITQKTKQKTLFYLSVFCSLVDLCFLLVSFTEVLAKDP